MGVPLPLPFPSAGDWRFYAVPTGAGKGHSVVKIACKERGKEGREMENNTGNRIFWHWKLSPAIVVIAVFSTKSGENVKKISEKFVACVKKQ